MRLIFLTNHWPYPPGETFLTSDLEALSKHIDEIIVIPVGLSFEESSEFYLISSKINVNIKPVTLAVKKWNRWGKFRRAIKGLTRLDILRSERSRKTITSMVDHHWRISPISSPKGFNCSNNYPLK